MSARIDSFAALEALYGEPDERSLIKEVDRLTPPYRAFVEASPFFTLATVGPGGLDCSPRGDAPGFVRVVDDRTLVLPDRRGNNRIDSLRNIVADPRVGLLFLIPGVGETLRINGRAELDADPALAESFAMDGKRPRLCIRIAIETVYFQCSRALVRASLWDPAARVDRASVPTAGAMLKACRESFDADAYDSALPERVKASLY